HPDRQVEFCIDLRSHGANPKVSNLINMAAGGLDEIIVISDSDVVIAPGALQRLVDAMAAKGVGAVTSLYRGRPVTNSAVPLFGALYLDGWFLPTAVLHARLATPQVCYGPLTAIRREVLAQAGGLSSLADSLADDTELGRLTRRQGLRIAFAPDVAETWVNERTWRELFQHELRWARMIRALEPQGYLASIFMHPGPLPLLLALLEEDWLVWAACAGVLLLRWALVSLTWRRFGRA